MDADGETLALIDDDGDNDADALALGEIEAEGETLALTDADGEIDAEGEIDALGEMEAEGLEPTCKMIFPPSSSRIKAKSSSNKKSATF